LGLENDCLTPPLRRSLLLLAFASPSSSRSFGNTGWMVPVKGTLMIKSVRVSTLGCRQSNVDNGPSLVGRIKGLVRVYGCAKQLLIVD